MLKRTAPSFSDLNEGHSLKSLFANETISDLEQIVEATEPLK